MQRTPWILWLALAAAAACGKVEGDDSGGDADGAVADAAPDARPLPTDPPVTNGQSAELVLGQPDFETTAGGLGDDRFQSATGLASDSQRLWVIDLRNARAVQFNAEPVINQPQADLAIGQASLTTNVSGPDALHLTSPPDDSGPRDPIGDVYSDGTVVAVADGEANRVLLWSQLPATSGVNWDIVLGQGSATSSTAGAGASGLNAPRGVWTDGQVLLVADTLNNRVLLWTSMPTVNAQPADVVLGQPDFDSVAAPDPPTPSSMNQPADVFFDGERLFVSDAQNNRVMVWNDMPTENNAPAEYFVGQTSGSTGGENAGAGPQEQNATGLHIPGQITVAHGSLYITDLVNFRVVLHTPRPTASGEEADAVLGFADFTGTPLEDGTQGFTPRGLAVFGDKLYLADSNAAFGGSRVLRYQLANLP
jgi:hypothetical protein